MARRILNGRSPGEVRVERGNQGFVVRCLAVLGIALGLCQVFAAEPSLSENQVKALFLMNFAKYVDWPPASLGEAGTPFVIGFSADEKFGDALRATVETKIINGHRILIRMIEAGDDAGKCHILFIRETGRKHGASLLDKSRGLPVLTVGEDSQFLEEGGVINFIKKEGKVRLEINLAAARLAQLEISAKLLGVADVVRGKSR